MVIAGHVSGTRGSGILFCASDVLCMSMVRGMRGVGGVCYMSMVWPRAVWVVRG